MHGRVPGTGFPHVLGSAGRQHVCTSVTGTLWEFHRHPGMGDPVGQAQGVPLGGLASYFYQE